MNVKLAFAGGACAALLLGALPARAESNEEVISANRTATAAAKATADAANLCAQGAARGVPCTATPTPAPSSTPVPTRTPVLLYTPAPKDAPPSPTPPPALPQPAEATPLSGYLRPSAVPGATPDPAGYWMELALPQGRWDVVNRCAADPASPYQPWTNVWVWSDPALPGDVLLGDVAYFTDAGQWSPCIVTQSVWTSDAPCALNDSGQCDVYVDASYWDALGQEPAAQAAQPPAEAPPTVADAVPDAPEASPTPPPLNYVPVPPASPPPPQVVTRIVYVTPVPVDAPPPEAYAYPTPGAVPSDTPAPAPAATSTPLAATPTAFTFPTPGVAPDAASESGGGGALAAAGPALAEPPISAPTVLAPPSGPSIFERLWAWWGSLWTVHPFDLPYVPPPVHDFVAELGHALQVVTPRWPSAADLKTVL